MFDRRIDVDKQPCSLKVLLIEDNRDFAYLLCSLLESMGHKCVPAYDGAEGIRTAKEINPDVIFCDIGLPGMDGFEVAKAIREDDKLKGAYIVALTGYAATRGLERGAVSDFDYYMAKPAGMAEIKQILDKAISGTGKR